MAEAHAEAVGGGSRRRLWQALTTFAMRRIWGGFEYGGAGVQCCQPQRQVFLSVHLEAWCLGPTARAYGVGAGAGRPSAASVPCMTAGGHEKLEAVAKLGVAASLSHRTPLWPLPLHLALALSGANFGGGFV